MFTDCSFFFAETEEAKPTAPGDFPQKAKAAEKNNETTLYCDCKAVFSTQAVTTKFSSWNNCSKKKHDYRIFTL